MNAQVAELERQVAQLLQARAEFARAPSVPELQLPSTIFDLQRCLGAQSGSQACSVLSGVPGCPDVLVFVETDACCGPRAPNAVLHVSRPQCCAADLAPQCRAVLRTSCPQCCGDAAFTELMGPAGGAG